MIESWLTDQIDPKSLHASTFEMPPAPFVAPDVNTAEQD